MIALVLALAQGGFAFRAQLLDAKVEVGAPARIVLECEHPRAESVRLTAANLGLDDSWVLLEAAPQEDRLLSGDHVLSLAAFQVASLEPGARLMDGIAVETRRGSEVERHVAAPISIEVQSLLGDSDLARPPKSFRPLPAEEPRSSLAPWFALLALFATAFVTWRVLRWRDRRRAVPAPPLSTAARFGELAARDLQDPSAVRAVHFEMLRLLRGEWDRRAGVDRSALDDAEWLALVRRTAATGADELFEQLAELIEAGSRVKWGGETATHWATQERLGRARELAEMRTRAEAKA